MRLHFLSFFANSIIGCNGDLFLTSIPFCSWLQTRATTLRPISVPSGHQVPHRAEIPKTSIFSPATSSKGCRSGITGLVPLFEIRDRRPSAEQQLLQAAYFSVLTFQTFRHKSKLLQTDTRHDSCAASAAKSGHNSRPPTGREEGGTARSHGRA